LKARLAALIRVRATERPGSGYREEAILPLPHVLNAGPVSRGEFSQMTGLGVTTTRKVLAQLLKDGLLQSASHVSVVGIGFPLDALNILFPSLHPEAATTVNDNGRQTGVLNPKPQSLCRHTATRGTLRAQRGNLCIQTCWGRMDCHVAALLAMTMSVLPMLLWWIATSLRFFA